MLNSISKEESTGCGNSYITTIYDPEGKLSKILLNLGKAGTCPRAFLTMWADTLTYLFSEIKLSKKQIIKLLKIAKGHTCHQGESTCVHVINSYILKLVEESTHE